MNTYRIHVKIKWPVQKDSFLLFQAETTDDAIESMHRYFESIDDSIYYEWISIEFNRGVENA